MNGSLLTGEEDKGVHGNDHDENGSLESSYFALSNQSKATSEGIVVNVEHGDASPPVEKGRVRFQSGGDSIQFKKPSPCSLTWFQTTVLLMFPNADYEDSFLTEYLQQNNRKMIGVTVLCTMLAVVTIIIAVVFEQQAWDATEQFTTSAPADAVYERIGIYGGLVCYVVGALLSRVPWFQYRWQVISALLMVIFASCRLCSAYLSTYGIDDRLCAAANSTEHGVDIIKLINLTQGVLMYGGGYQKGQADSGLAFLPMWLVFFGPVFRHLFMLCVIICIINVVVFKLTACMALIGATAYTVAYTWMIMCYVVLLFLFWGWEWNMRRSFHLENVLAEENIDLGRVANPFSADSLKDYIRRKQLSIAARPSVAGRPKTLSTHRQADAANAAAAGKPPHTESAAYGSTSSRPSLGKGASSRNMRRSTQPWDLDAKELTIVQKIAAGSGGAHPS